MTPEQFETACKSLKNYFGVIGVFGGCPTISPHFEAYCEILRSYFPKHKCGLWANNLFGKGAAARQTFNPAVSNLNVHLDKKAYDEFRRDWPESRPFGLDGDSRHAPVFVAMKDVIEDEGKRWELISNCDINKHWSALVGVFRGELRGWFCEIAGSQAILHQHNPDYPDTGIPIGDDGMSVDPNGHPALWWRLGMNAYAHQVRKHCHECSVPLRGHGELSQAKDGVEQVSLVHLDVAKPKVKDRKVEVVKELKQLGKPLGNVVRYLQNAKGQ